MGDTVEKKSFGLLLLIIIIFLTGVFSLLIIDDLKKDRLERENIRSVTNISTFYTVESCANKYVSYLMNKDYKVIYKLLDDKYIRKYNITEENLNNYIEVFDKKYGLKIEKMYQYRGFDIYYIKAKLIEDGMGITRSLSKDFKVTVKLDKNNSKFSIIPDGDGGILDD